MVGQGREGRVDLGGRGGDPRAPACRSGRGASRPRRRPARRARASSAAGSAGASSSTSASSSSTCGTVVRSATSSTSITRSSWASTWRRCPSSPRIAIVIRDLPGSWVVPTVSDSMLKLRARSSPGHAVQRPGPVDDEGAHHVAALLRVRLAGGQGLASRGRGGGRHSAAPSTMSDRPLPGSIMG